jgi:hypothetical protein
MFTLTGGGLGDGLGDMSGLGLGDTSGLGLGDTSGLGLGDTPGLGLAFLVQIVMFGPAWHRRGVLH